MIHPGIELLSRLPVIHLHCPVLRNIKFYIDFTFQPIGMFCHCPVHRKINFQFPFLPTTLSLNITYIKLARTKEGKGSMKNNLVLTVFKIKHTPISLQTHLSIILFSLYIKHEHKRHKKANVSWRSALCLLHWDMCIEKFN